MGNNERNSRFIKSSDLNFFNLQRHYLKEHELISIFHLTISLIISIVFIFFISTFNLDIFIKDTINIIISTSIGILGVLIASFGIFAAVTDINFYIKIYKLDELRNTLFPFWFCSTLWTSTLLIGLFFLLLTNIRHLIYSNYYLLFPLLLLFMISLGYTLGLIGDILKLIVFKVQIEVKEDNVKDKNKVKINNIYSENNNDKNFKKIYKKYLNFYILLSTIVFFYQLLWYYFFKNYTFSSIILGALYIFFIFLSIKYHRKLEINNNLKTLLKMRNVIKIYLLLLSLWGIILFS